MSFFSNTVALILVVTILLVHTSTVKGVRGPAPGDEGQCDGRLLDLSRLETMRGFGQGPGGGPAGSTQPVISREGIVIDTDSWYTVKGGPIVPFAISRRNMECNYGRSRLHEELQGVPVYGADMIMSFGGNCAPGGNSRNYEWWSAEDQPENAPPMSLTQILNDFQVRDMFAKSFRDVRVPQGYTPAFSIDKAKEIVADFYNIPAQDIDSNVTLYVYPSQPQDYLTYFVEVIVPVPGSTAVYRVVLDAHSAEFLSVCTFVDPDVDRRRREHVQQEVQKQQQDDNNRHLLRSNDQNRRLQDICQSCATVEDIASFLGTTTCPINTLYLDDSGKTVTCTQATTTSGGTIFVPYPDTALFWNGAYDCQNSVGPCSLVDIPDCQDAISDVTFSALQTLQYLQSSLNVLGGLSSDASVPQWLNGLVHYDTDYCNAFYSSNRIVFGDCDCDILTPLVSIDITAHEVMHGVTQKHSNLEYSGESGGLNEGYSDIMGSVMEFVINDSQDTPDFTLGEVLGGFYGIIRFMEDPPLDGQSVGSICDYTSSLNVHHSSGILNKAFVKAVRACQANGCLSTEFDCTLLVGPLFLYTNLQLLTSLSTFLDGALQTCIMVEEFLDTIAEYDSCDQETLTQFVIDGWAAVDITIDSTSCNSATTSCSGTTPNPTPAPVTSPSPTPVPTPFPTLNPTPAPTAAPPTVPICFSKVATVPVKNRGPVPMSQLAVGDNVLTANGYQPIYAFAHRSATAWADFIQIHTQGRNQPLEVSREHLVFLSNSSTPVRADSVIPGDTLKDVEGQKGALISGVDIVTRQGLYAPLTHHGTLVVDGIISSCYVSLQSAAKEYIELQNGVSTGISQHFFVHMTLAPLRVVCSGISNKFCQTVNSESGLNRFVEFGLSIAKFAESQPVYVQLPLLTFHVMAFGPILVIEWMMLWRGIFELSVFVTGVILMMGGARRRARNATKGVKAKVA